MNKGKNFICFAKARRFARKLQIKSNSKWYNYCKSGLKPPHIPSAPSKVYKREWDGWKDWLGNEFLPYKKARLFVLKLKFKNVAEWRRYCKLNIKPRNVPSNPNVVYEDSWRGWPHFLGYSYSFRKYNINENFFKKWSCDMAYVLGLWFADGHIRKNQFIITLHQRDKYLLEQILKKMNANYSVVNHMNNACRIIMCSKAMVGDVLKLGGKFKKSLDIKFPRIPKKYLPDFIRGLWDGDGCVSYDRASNYYKSSIVSGSRDFIYELHIILKKECNVSGYIRVIKRKKGSNILNKKLKKDCIAYSICLGCNDTKRLRNYMYANNGLGLNRKYEKFLDAGEIRLAYRDIKRLTFLEIREYARKLKLKKREDWFEYWKIKKRPQNIPFDPYLYYRHKGWEGWKDFLGNSLKIR